jgi:hypothetical protein
LRRSKSRRVANASLAVCSTGRAFNASSPTGSTLYWSDGAYYFASTLKSDPGDAIDLQAALDMRKRRGKTDAINRNYTEQCKWPTS